MKFSSVSENVFCEYHFQIFRSFFKCWNLKLLNDESVWERLNNIWNSAMIIKQRREVLYERRKWSVKCEEKKMNLLNILIRISWIMKACWRWNNKWSSWNMWTSAMMIILSSANNNEKIFIQTCTIFRYQERLMNYFNSWIPINWIIRTFIPSSSN